MSFFGLFGKKPEPVKEALVRQVEKAWAQLREQVALAQDAGLHCELKVSRGTTLGAELRVSEVLFSGNLTETPNN